MCKVWERWVEGFPQAARENWEFIDTIDFIPYIDRCERIAEATTGNDFTIYSLMQEVEKDYKNLEKPACCEGFVFNWVDEDEFSRYLENRYAGLISVREEVTYLCLIHRANN